MRNGFWGILGGIAFTVAFLLAFSVVVTIKKYNNFVEYENQLEMVQKDGENLYSKMFNTLKSKGLTEKKYVQGVKELTTLIMDKKYSKDSALAFVAENNPEINPSIYKDILNSIEANYQANADIQTRRFDILRTYKTELQSFPGNIIASYFGFPRSDLKGYGRVISNSAARKAYEANTSEVINPF